MSTVPISPRAKRIVNHAVVNEDPNAKIIRELRSEIETLKELLIHTADPQMLKVTLKQHLIHIADPQVLKVTLKELLIHTADPQMLKVTLMQLLIHTADPQGGR